MSSLDFVRGGDSDHEWDFCGGREAWAMRFKEVKGWLEMLPSDHTRVLYRDRSYRFFRWLFENGEEFAALAPRELVDLQEKAAGRARYAQVRLLHYFVNNVLKGTKSYKEQFISAVRSFYAHNYVELPRDPNFMIRVDRETIPGRLIRDELRQLLLSAPIPYRAVYACMLVGFMGRREFTVFNTSESVRLGVVNGAQVVRVELPGRKRGKPFYTLVGGDGLRLLREYLSRVRGTPGPGEPLFLNSRGQPLNAENVSRTFKNLAAGCGLIRLKTPRCQRCRGETRKKMMWFHRGGRKGGKVHYVCLSCGFEAPASEAYKGMKSARYGVRAHELRDLAKTLWYRSGTSEKWLADFFSGRTDQVDPNDYLKAMEYYPDWVEDTYRKSLPWLNVVSEDPEKVPAKDFNRLQEELADTRKAIKEAEWLLSDPEVSKILRTMVEERKRR